MVRNKTKQNTFFKYACYSSIQNETSMSYMLVFVLHRTGNLEDVWFAFNM